MDSFSENLFSPAAAIKSMRLCLVADSLFNAGFRVMQLDGDVHWRVLREEHFPDPSAIVRDELSDADYDFLRGLAIEDSEDLIPTFAEHGLGSPEQIVWHFSSRSPR